MRKPKATLPTKSDTEKVSLFADGVGNREFKIEVAESILNSKSKPIVWQLADSDYDFTNGKIIRKPDGEVIDRADKTED